MADSLEFEQEKKQLRTTGLEAATSISQIRQQAHQEIHRTNQLLEQRTREVVQALAIMRATLESTADAIVVTDGKFNVIELNEKFTDMWKIPRELLKRGIQCDVGELAKHNFDGPQQFIARTEEILASGRESLDLLELKDGRILERYSKVLLVEGKGVGCVWSCRDVTEHRVAAITAGRLAAIVTSSDDASSERT